MAEDLLLEIGAEELPASFVEPALADLARGLGERLASARLTHGSIATYGTPRRLAVLASAVSSRSPDAVREVLGPPLRVAFGADGGPTQAALKFAAGQSKPVSALRRVQTPKGEYLAADVEEPGQVASALLPPLLHALVHGLAFRKSMRWGNVEQPFARPVHWILALHGAELLPLVFGDVRSGRQTRGHRFLAPEAIALSHPEEYLAALERAHVLADVEVRKERLRAALEEAASRAGGHLLADEALLDQVNELVEWPSPVAGGFDPRHLDLPPEVLVQEMKSHQRYFSLVDADGRLLPWFIAVSGTPVRDEAVSRRGYERVLRARLTDGRFFFDEDRKVPLAARVPALARVTFQGKLGSYAEKVERVRALAGVLVRATGRQSLAAVVDRVALLCKADLTTGMVGEFPELQGVMGREYAVASGEPAEVARGIFEHYLPRGLSDALPTDDAGALVGIADRLDTLAGLFALGKPPTASADPFALRRACLGVIRLTVDRGVHFSLRSVVETALGALAPKLSGLKGEALAGAREALLDFFRARLRALWTEEVRSDVVEAVLEAGFDDLTSAERRLQALSATVATPEFEALAAGLKRAANIVAKQGRDVSRAAPDPSRFTEAAERVLFSAASAAAGEVQRALGRGDAGSALRSLAPLKPAVDGFFAAVLVMAEDPAVRENRIRLLMQVTDAVAPLADVSRIQVDVGGAR